MRSLTSFRVMLGLFAIVFVVETFIMRASGVRPRRLATLDRVDRPTRRWDIPTRRWDIPVRVWDISEEGVRKIGGVA